MSEISLEHVKAGQAPYNKLLLAIYDPYAPFNYRLLWRCPPGRVLDLYDGHVSGNRLDVGVTTGTILEYCRFPTPSPRLALMDLNPNGSRSSGQEPVSIPSRDVSQERPGAD